MSAVTRLSAARLALAASAALGVFLAPGLAQAKVQITVDLDKQTIHVEGKSQTYDWKVSSGAFGHETPSGKYGVLWMDKDHHSDEYDQAPMPNAVFFAPGYAIHGASKSQWGHPASHGCVRLPVAKSAILFDMVKAEGADVTITGYSPNNKDTVAAEGVARRAKAAAAAPQDVRGPDARAVSREDEAQGYGGQGYAGQDGGRGYGAQGYDQGSARSPSGGYETGFDDRRPDGFEDVTPRRGGAGGLFGSVY